jgi:hypothetical protein
MRKVLHGVSPQPEPVSLNDGNIQNTGQRAGHLSSLRRDLRFSAQEIASFEYSGPEPPMTQFDDWPSLPQ